MGIAACIEDFFIFSIGNAVFPSARKANDNLPELISKEEIFLIALTPQKLSY